MRELTNRWAWEIGNGSEQRVVISKWWTLNAFRRRVAFGVGVVDSRLLYVHVLCKVSGVICCVNARCCGRYAATSCRDAEVV